MPVISLQKPEGELRAQPRIAQKALRRLLLPFGGGEFFFSPQEIPLFLLDLSLPADNEMGVNFDLRLAYAMISLARGQGASRIRLGARVSEGFDFDTVLEKSGYARLRELSGVELLDLSAPPIKTYATDTALILDQAEISELFYTSDIVISLAKFKAADGQLFGSALHTAASVARLPEGFSFEQRQRAMVDIYSIAAPDLTVVDGLRGDGKFQPQPADFLLAAMDAVAADAALSAIAGIDLDSVEYLQLAAQYGLGIGDPAAISLFGDDMSEIML